MAQDHISFSPLVIVITARPSEHFQIRWWKYVCMMGVISPLIRRVLMFYIKSKWGQIRPHCFHIYFAGPAVPRSLYHSAEPQKTSSLTSIKKKPWFVQRQITIKTSRKFPFFFPQAISIYVLAMIAIPYDGTIIFQFILVVVYLIKYSKKISNLHSLNIIKIRCLNISAFFS